jgi:predicted ATPase
VSYRYSILDNKNLKWFTQDTSKGTLVRIKIVEGQIRGLKTGFEVHFQYPITAIAGKNGSGKTTALALAACAYHNNDRTDIIFKRKKSYYTLSDFFIQSKEEVFPEGITIGYQFLHNKWKKRFAGLGWQKRIKKQGGRWNDYSKRVRRDVVHLGIGRIVPPTENSASRNYKGVFSPIGEQGWERSVAEIVGSIIDKDYSSFYYQNHSKYYLPVVSAGETTYSGFNMGAGENALFEMFSVILSLPAGFLLLVDEIELGLHEKAQRKLIEQLKIICEKTHMQVICTTHSSAILDCLPPEGRIFLEDVGDESLVTSGISSLFASGKLSGRNNAELDIFVEDEVAQSIIEASINHELRIRTNIIPIGSAPAVMRQLAANYRLHNGRSACVILDGDQKSNINDLVKDFINTLEISTENKKRLAREWVNKRRGFLPGSDWPEKWLLSSCLENQEAIEAMANEFDLPENEMTNILKDSIRAGKHKEFYTLGEYLHIDENYVQKRCSKIVMQVLPDEAQQIQDFILTLLD